jgi:SOS-response transcriptional repressor LexA
MLLVRTDAGDAEMEDQPAMWGDAPALEPLSSITRERRRVLVLIGLVWMIVAGLYMLPTLVHDRRDIGVPIIISHVGISIVGGALSGVLLLIIARARRAGKRAALLGSTLGVVTIACAMAAADIAFFDFVHGLFDREQSPGVPYIARWTSNFAVFMSQFSLIAVTFWMLETLEANRVKQVELELSRRLIVEAQNTASRAKLAALRYQLNPHFLFNTLNSISSLVITKRLADAEKMLSLLSEFLRSTLAQDPEAPQTLEGELETVEAYLAIERIRFGERLAVEVDCPPALRDAPIAHFLLQPLVENAIKHGVAPSDETVTIRIAARANDGDLVVAIENDCQVGQASAAGTQVGLRNVRERLAAVYGQHGHLETIERESGYLALVRFPLRNAVQ